MFLNIPIDSRDKEEKKYKVGLMYLELLKEYDIDIIEVDSMNNLMSKLEQLSTENKTTLLPKYFLNKDLINKNNSEWEDFKYLIKIRNMIMHYKFNDRNIHNDINQIITHLRKKKIKLASDYENRKVTYYFFAEISTNECIKYFINFIFKMIRELNVLLKKSEFETFKNKAIFDVGYDDIK